MFTCVHISRLYTRGIHFRFGKRNIDMWFGNRFWTCTGKTENDVKAYILTIFISVFDVYTSTGTSWVCWISTGCSCWDWKHIENVIYGCEYPAAGLVFTCFSKLMPLILRPRDTKQQTWNQPTVRPENVFLFKRFSNAYNSWRTVSFSYQTHFILCICPFKWLYL